MATEAGLMVQDTVAGYRLLRRLGSGSRAEVHLGYVGAVQTDEQAQANGAAQPRTAALKLFFSTTSADSIDAEIRALAVADHAHVVQLRDLSRGEDGRPVLVLERLEPRSLGQLLASRAVLGAGEAVTILAPVAAAVAALHESGVVHAAIAPSRLLFRESGAPVLSGFGYATRVAPQGVELDNRAVASLALAVLERVDSAQGIRSWLGDRAGYPDFFLAQLSERLFDLADATPVRFTGEGAPAELVPARAVPVVAVPAVAGPWEPAPSFKEGEAQQVRPARPSDLAARLRDRIDGYLAPVPPRFRRPRYAALAAGVVALVVAVAVVPPGQVAGVDPGPSIAPVMVDTGPLAADDPVAAFGELVRLRNQCIRDLSILCLDSVLQPGSAAMEHDVALIRSLEQGAGGEAVLHPGRVRLVERMGDAALLGYAPAPPSEPASVLLVKGEAGWRIRSYLQD